MRNEPEDQFVQDSLLMNDARKLTRTQAERLELRLLRRPEDQSTRLKLVSYYCLKWRDPKLARTRARNIAWFVDHAPDREILHAPWFQIDHGCSARDAETIRLKWLNQVKRFRRDPMVAGNASSYFFRHDFEAGIRLLKKAQKLDPGNERWIRELSFRYYLEARYSKSPVTQRKMARQMLRWGDQFLTSHRRTHRVWKLDQLEYCARSAVILSDYLLAADYASRALRIARRWNESPPDFCHPVLGLAYLTTAKAGLACRHLLNSERKRAVCDLEVELANKLLEHGAEEAVMQYLKHCGAEELLPMSAIRGWINDLKSGRPVEIKSTAEMQLALRGTNDPWTRINRSPRRS